MLRPDTWLNHNRYRIIEKIGRGGFGVVYRAEDLQENQIVALKELNLDDHTFPLDRRPAIRQAFKEEAMRLRKLSHVALPEGIDYFEEGGAQYFVMEYIEGEDLEVLLREQGGPFTVEDVLRWADQLLAVLTYLHEQKHPVIHRDIKPSNLKLKPNGQIVLLDFGIAKGGLTQYSPDTILRKARTEHFSSPEQIEGEPTDARSDLYSLAATLYWLLTNYLPERVPERKRAIKRGDSDLLSPANELNDQVSATLAELLSRTMAIKPTERPATAEQLGVILKAQTLYNQLGSDFAQDQALTQEIVKLYHNAPDDWQLAKLTLDAVLNLANRAQTPPLQKERLEVAYRELYSLENLFGQVEKADAQKAHNILSELEHKFLAQVRGGSSISPPPNQPQNDRRPIVPTEPGGHDSSPGHPSVPGTGEAGTTGPLPGSLEQKIKSAGLLILGGLVGIMIWQGVVSYLLPILAPPPEASATLVVKPVNQSATETAPSAIVPELKMLDSTHEFVEIENGRQQMKVTTHLGIQGTASLDLKTMIEVETRLPPGLSAIAPGSPEIEIKEDEGSSETIVTQRVSLNNVDPMNVRFESLYMVEWPHSRQASYTIPITARLLSADGVASYLDSKPLEIGPITHEAAFSMTQSLSNTLVAIGDTILFSVTLTNTGQTWLDKLVIKPENMPAELNADTNKWQKQLDALGALEPGQTGQIWLQAQVNTDQPRKLDTTLPIEGLLGDQTPVQPSSSPFELETYSIARTIAPPASCMCDPAAPLKPKAGYDSPDNRAFTSIPLDTELKVLGEQEAEGLKWYFLEVLTPDGEPVRGWLWSQRTSLDPPPMDGHD